MQTTIGSFTQNGSYLNPYNFLAFFLRSCADRRAQIVPFTLEWLERAGFKVWSFNRDADCVMRSIASRDLRATEEAEQIIRDPKFVVQHGLGYGFVIIPADLIFTGETPIRKLRRVIRNRPLKIPSADACHLTTFKLQDERADLGYERVLIPHSPFEPPGQVPRQLVIERARTGDKGFVIDAYPLLSKPYLDSTWGLLLEITKKPRSAPK